MFISSSIILLSISAFAWEIGTPEHLDMVLEKLEEARE